MAGAGAAWAALPRFVGACGDDATAAGEGGAAMDTSDAGMTGAEDAGFVPAGFAPNEPWWLQGNYAPVENEVEAFDLPVEGTLPKELTGLYVRNGSNAQGADNGHWFIGQGMAHGVRLERGKAKWYRNRWVRTPLFDRPPSDAIAPPTLTDTASNVSLVHHAGKLLALGEVGLPYELSPEDLSTRGVYDFGGKLMTNMTAHPKLDPVTGEMLMFGYNWAKPYLTYHQVDAKGALVRSEPIDVPGPMMMHDFAITKRHVVFMDLPIVFKIDLAIAGEAFPFRWDDAHGARMGVMPRDGGSDDVVWFEIPPCFVFHVMNAYEDPDDDAVVVLEGARYEKLWADDAGEFDQLPRLTRWRLDLGTKKASEAPLDDRNVEFPQLDRRLLGLPYRYGYGLELVPRDAGVAGRAGGVLKFDHQRGTVQTHPLHLAEQSDEVIFIPASDAAGEDEGYLVSFVYDERDDRSRLTVLDATDVTKKPIARVELPQRVPFGFHGIWIPG
jgi:carotenoid cleavage dioxygenase